MGGCFGRPIEVTLSNLLEHIRCFTSCCGGQITIENYGSSTDGPINSDVDEGDEIKYENQESFSIRETLL